MLEGDTASVFKTDEYTKQIASKKQLASESNKKGLFTERNVGL
jgi:hypothetical protein